MVRGLGPEGLAELSRRFRAGLDGIGLAGGAQHRRTCIEGLGEVDDARGDVDAFIEAQRLAGAEDRAMMPIAEGLVAAGRLDEALQRLERATGGEHRNDGLDDLRIEVLDRLGWADDAQAVRWGVFLRTLSKQHARRLPRTAACGGVAGCDRESRGRGTGAPGCLCRVVATFHLCPGCRRQAGMPSA